MHGDPIPSALLETSFLEDLSMAYNRRPDVRDLLVKAWASHKLDDASTSCQISKSSLSRMLEDNVKPDSSRELEDTLQRTASLLKALYQYGQFLMVGSDILDSLAMCYKHQKAAVQKKVLITAYLCLNSLMEPESPKMSTLIDHLYSLKSASDQSSLLQELCSSTPLLRRLRTRLSGPDAARAKSLLQQLSTLEKTASGKPRRLVKRKIDKGKSRATEQFEHHASSNAQFHQMSLITQIQDLFPDLGSAFIVKLLDEYHDDVEQVTAHLLDGSLPTHLLQADQRENISHLHDNQSLELAPALVPRSVPIDAPQIDKNGSGGRRTVFDDDAFSNLTISPNQVHYGRATNIAQTADDLLSTLSSALNKAAILSALATFDADDDERDDTYDVEDVGGTVDSAMPGTSDDVMDAEGLKHDQSEETLFQAWKMSPQMFGRDPKTRRSQARVALRSETRMTDEAIEGWVIMLQRDPGRLRRLEAKSSVSGIGQQRGLGRTAWTNTPAGSGTTTEGEGHTDGDAGTAARGGRGGGTRGRGSGTGGGRGNVAGPTDDKGTQLARQRKDANKGSRANHNRRAQRAKKMARGGFPG